ncbi:hypothetical protein ACWESM_18775 [Nocardia sp. NPDC003999]
MTPTPEFETFDLDAVCEFTGAPSADWLYRRITSGELTAVLAGRRWRMTHSDMSRVVAYMRAAAAAELAKRPAATPTTAAPSPATAGLSARGAARMRKRAAA